MSPATTPKPRGHRACKGPLHPVGWGGSSSYRVRRGRGGAEPLSSSTLQD